MWENRNHNYKHRAGLERETSQKSIFLIFSASTAKKTESTTEDWDCDLIENRCAENEITFFKILLDNLYVTVTKNVWQTAKILFNTRTTNKTTLSYMTKRVQSIEFA